MLNIVKLYSTPDGRGFVAWGRSVFHSITLYVLLYSIYAIVCFGR
jgi:hypothetical protein